MEIPEVSVGFHFRPLRLLTISFVALLLLSADYHVLAQSSVCGDDPCCCPDTGLCLPPDPGECPGEGDCEDKYGNPIECPDGGGGGEEPPEECFDKFNNPIECPDECGCCDPSSSNYNASVALAAGCGGGGGSEPCGDPNLTGEEWSFLGSMFPLLHYNHSHRTAPANPVYNCHAYAMNRTDFWLDYQMDLDSNGMITKYELQIYFSANGVSGGYINYGNLWDGVLHSARSGSCAESKVGAYIRMYHIPEELEGFSYGNIF